MNAPGLRVRGPTGRMYRKTGYILARIAGLLAVLLMTAVVAIQTPFVQTRLSRIALNRLAAVMDGRIRYDELRVMTSGVILIRNLTLVDDAPYTEDRFERGWAPVDTVLKIRTVTATFALDGLFKGEGLHLGRVTVEDGLFHLAVEPDRPGNNLSRIFRMKPQEGPKEPGGPDVFDIKKVRINNFRFRMSNFCAPHAAPSPHPDAPRIDFEDLDVVAGVTAHNLRMSGGKMSGVCDRLSAVEKSGYVLEDASGSVEVGPGRALIEDLRIRDAWSDISLRSFSMRYAWAVAFKHFLQEVQLDAEVRESRVALQTLTYFSGQFDGSPTAFELQRGTFSGSVSDFRLERFALSEQNTAVSATVDGRISGIPDSGEMAVNARVSDLKGTPEAIARLVSDMFGTRLDLGRIGRGIPLTMQIRADGPLSALNVEADVRSPEGNFQLDGQLNHLTDPRRPLEASVRAQLQELDLGRILGTEALGAATLRTRLHASLGSGLPEAVLDTLYIEKIRALGHDFQHISAVGGLENGTARIQLHGDDPAARFDLSALADLTERESGSRYRLNGSLSELELGAFGIDGGDRISRIAAQVHADLVRNGEFLDGSVLLQQLRFSNADGLHTVGDIRLSAANTGGEQQLRLDAPFLQASYRGTHPVPRFIADLRDAGLRRELPVLFPAPAETDGTGSYAFELAFRDTRELFAALLPGVYIEENSGLRLYLEENGALSGQLLSGRLASGKNYLKDVDLRLDNDGGALTARMNSSELRANAFAVNHPALLLSADDDRLTAGLRFDSFSGAGGKGEIRLNAELSRDPDGELVIRARPQDSFLVADEETWTLSASDIVLHGKSLRFDRLLLGNGPQRLLVDGGFSGADSDTLTVQMNRFDLALIDEFLPAALGIEGRMNGRALISSAPEAVAGMLMNIRIDSLRVGGVDAGNIRLASQWNDEGQELGMLLLDELHGREALRANGSYFIRDRQLDLRADLDRFPLEVAEPFLSEIFSEMGGGISGRIGLHGPMDKLAPASDGLHLEDALLRIAITGVPYTASGPLRLDRNGLYFDTLAVRDDEAGTGTIDGALRFANLQDFTLDSRLEFDNLKVLDAAERPGNSFYGFLRATGSAAVTGPLSALLIDANVSTSGDGNIHIPLSNGLLATNSSNLLTFTEQPRELDAYEEMLAGMDAKTRESSDLHIRGRLTLTPGTKAFVEIDKSAGNVASFSGQGTVSLNLRPSKAVFELNGDYNINEGNYQFVIPGILNKAFSIQQGSSVKFGGDLMNTELDIAATYELRTSLDALINSQSSSRRQVLCGINITDRLRAPQLGLSIDIPDLDPTTRSEVESALNTTDKIQKQFVSLLLLGSFLADDFSGVSNRGSNLLFSNVVEMLSGQINNVLQRLEIPVDVGFGYQQMDSGNNLFDIAVSTQLFDDRVILGGNFGNRRYSTGSSSGDFMGNMDLQVKLDPEGKFRFNVFSRSADEFTNFLDYSQRNGIGVSYQREYNDFRDFLRRLFVPKARREERGQEAPETELEPIVIEIENEPGQTLPDPDAPRRERSRRGAAPERP